MDWAAAREALEAEFDTTADRQEAMRRFKTARMAPGCDPTVSFASLQQSSDQASPGLDGALRHQLPSDQFVEGGDWEVNLPMVLLPQHASIQPTTGKSPSMLMYGRHPRLPVDQKIGLWPTTRLSPEELDEERRKARESLTNVQATSRQKTASRKTRSFPIGAKVKWKDHQNPGRSGLGSRKLGSRWQGPFVVTDRRGNVYTIQDSRRSKRVNGTQLRKWHDTPEERPSRPAAGADLTEINEQRWHADDL
ncbi:hypothetical protein CLF_110144 [Clonorchis sinensis]|uniref:Gap-Pol polyprotein n=1 Tax=Clonorchis sinensis TaxID=79923 RepID=G7YKB6_CLOSI|nr:hypothetical protein CLF_110144 [Clonorchis sinensis]